MKTAIGAVEVALFVGDRRCRVPECGYRPDNYIHRSVADCSAAMERECDTPEEHHRYQRPLLPVNLKVRRLW